MATDFSGHTAGPHLDLPAALSNIGEESAVRNMLRMLADLLAQDVPKIQQALLSRDLASAARLLHSLKGSMPIFCSPPICDQVALVERLSKQGESNQAQQAYVQLDAAFVELVLEIQHHLVTPTAKQD